MSKKIKAIENLRKLVDLRKPFDVVNFAKCSFINEY